MSQKFLLTVLKIALLLVAIPLGLALTAATYLGAMLLYMEVISPRLHVWRTARAEAMNDVLWNTGMATVYTVEAKVLASGQAFSSRSADVICARKVETEAGDIKGGPYRWDSVMYLGASEVTVQPLASFSVIFPMGSPCSELEKIREAGSLPAVVVTYRRAVLLQRSDPADSCAPSLGLVQPSQLMLVATRQAPARSVLTREAFGPADRRRAHPSNARPNYLYQYQWMQESMCWEAPAANKAGSLCLQRPANVCAS